MSEPITAKEYHDQIRSICQSAIDEYKEHGGDEEPEEWFSDWLHGTIDGHQWVIYTWYNTQVLTHTDNRDAYWDMFGEPPRADSYNDMMATLAACAMEADVQAHIDMSAFGEVAE